MDLIGAGVGVVLLGLIIVVAGVGQASAPAVPPVVKTEAIDPLLRMRPVNATPGEVWSLKGGEFAEIMPPSKDGTLNGLGVYYEGPGPHALAFYSWRQDGTLIGTGWTGQELSMRVDKPSVYGGKYPEWLND